MQNHAYGIHFREWNAGTAIDAHMTNDGFNIDIHLDPTNGLIFGGNKWNCGTWMDKMGESERAGTKGTPATPRDGAAIEIIGLLKSTLRWLSELHQEGIFPYSGVSLNDRQLLTYKEWDRILCANFEYYFWIPEDPTDDEKYHVIHSVVHK